MNRLESVWNFMKGTAVFLWGLLCMLKSGLCSKDAQGFYDKLASRYDSLFGDDARAAEEMVENHLAGGETVLDVACGTGVTTIPLLGKFSQVYGVDISQGMLSQARAKPETAKIRFVQGSFAALPFSDASFDAAICVGAIWHLREKDEKKFAEEIQRILKPGGVFITTVQVLDSKPTIGNAISKLLGKTKYVRDKVQLGKFTAEYITEMFSKSGFATSVSHVRISNGKTGFNWPIVKVCKLAEDGK